MSTVGGGGELSRHEGGTKTREEGWGGGDLTAESSIHFELRVCAVRDSLRGFIRLFLYICKCTFNNNMFYKKFVQLELCIMSIY